MRLHLLCGNLGTKESETEMNVSDENEISQDLSGGAMCGRFDSM